MDIKFDNLQNDHEVILFDCANSYPKNIRKWLEGYIHDILFFKIEEFDKHAWFVVFESIS